MARLFTLFALDRGSDGELVGLKNNASKRCFESADEGEDNMNVVLHSGVRKELETMQRLAKD